MFLLCNNTDKLLLDLKCGCNVAKFKKKVAKFYGAKLLVFKRLIEKVSTKNVTEISICLL